MNNRFFMYNSRNNMFLFRLIINIFIIININLIIINLINIIDYRWCK